MSRYIDADKMLEICTKYVASVFPNSYKFAKQDAELLVAIEEAEHKTIDIVRCEECKHWIGETEHYEDREYKACWQLCGQYMNSEFWCKYGEREGE